MRMRLKKHLDERIAATEAVLIAREAEKFYEMTEEEKQRFNIDVGAVFGNNHPVCLEIGCGKGAFAIEIAKRNPNKNYLAVEKLSNVIVVACEAAQKENLVNLRFLNCRAENLLCYLPTKSVAEILLNFSCPYPKKTYANRRLTSKNFLEIYKKILTTDGIIAQKTDNKDFFDYSIQSLSENGFDVYDICDNVPIDAPDNVPTEYEMKFRALGMPIYSLKAKLKRME